MNDQANEKKRHGGKRIGAGRPKSSDPQKLRPTKVNDENWKLIEKLAQKENLSYGDLYVKLAKNYKEEKQA